MKRDQFSYNDTSAFSARISTSSEQNAKKNCSPVAQAAHDDIFLRVSRRVKFKFVRIMRATDGAVLSGKRGREETGEVAPRARCLSRIRNYSAIKKRLFCIDEDNAGRRRRVAPRRAACHQELTPE